MTDPRIASVTEFRLLALLDFHRELSGLEVAEEYRQELGRDVSPGTLYATLSRMHAKGWVSQRDDEDADGRLRFFKVTSSGLKVLASSRAHFAALASFQLRTT